MRRYVIPLVVLCAALAGCNRIKQFADSPAAKFYRQYRKEAVQEDVTQYMELIQHNFTDHNLDVIKSEEQDGVYLITAKEVTRWMPPNAAANNFATIVKRELYAEVQEIDGAWQVTSEEVTSEEISTYDQRQ